MDGLPAREKGACNESVEVEVEDADLSLDLGIERETYGGSFLISGNNISKIGPTTFDSIISVNGVSDGFAISNVVAPPSPPPLHASSLARCISASNLE